MKFFSPNNDGVNDVFTLYGGPGARQILNLKVFDRWGGRLPLTLRIALRNLCRQPAASVSCFLALGLGVMLLNVIPQIEASIQAELTHPEQSKLPSFFLFDIQEDQVEAFRKTAEATGASVGKVSPMVRARLVEVNGKRFEK